MGSVTRLRLFLGLLVVLLISGISGAMSGIDNGASGAAPEKAAPADIPPRVLGGRGFGGEKIKSWPELVGKDGELAKKHISEDMPTLKQVIVLPQNSIVTRDYRVDRVRVFVDDKNVVVKAPAQG